jgi:chemotaxis methyl-accepting protein methylase
MTDLNTRMAHRRLQKLLEIEIEKLGNIIITLEATVNPEELRKLIDRLYEAETEMIRAIENLEPLQLVRTTD